MGGILGARSLPPKRLIAGDLPARNLSWRLPFPSQVEPYLEVLGFSPANMDALLRGVALAIFPLLVLVVRLHHFFHASVSFCGRAQVRSVNRVVLRTEKNCQGC